MVLTFSHNVSGDVVVLKVIGRDIIFGSISGGKMQYAPLEGLKFSIAGIVKEFPDLKGKPLDHIRREGLECFKKHFWALASWEAKKNYLRKDLEGHGYKMVMQQLPGQRARKA